MCITDPTVESTRVRSHESDRARETEKLRNRESERQIERGRQRQRDRQTYMYICKYVYIYIYICLTYNPSLDLCPYLYLLPISYLYVQVDTVRGQWLSAGRSLKRRQSRGLNWGPGLATYVLPIEVFPEERGRQVGFVG